MASWHRQPLSSIHLADGRWLVASVSMGYGHPRIIFHFALALLALLIGVAAFPIVRPHPIGRGIDEGVGRP